MKGRTTIAIAAITGLVLAACYSPINPYTLLPNRGGPSTSVSIWDGGFANYDWFTGQVSPFTITTAAQLKGFANIVNGDDGQAVHNFSGETVTLARNINLANHAWTPIGNDLNPFAGTFNGGSRTITGLSVNLPLTDYVGFFGRVTSFGVVSNLSISGTVNGNNNVGGVVGRNDGTVENSHNAGTVSGNNNVGGVVGGNIGVTSMVKNSHNTGTVNGPNNVGGVVGRNDGTVENNHNTGTVNGNNNVGGVVGWNNGGTVENSHNAWTVSGSGSQVGGVVGTNSGGTVENSYNTGNVDGSSTVGGVVGWNNGGTVENSYNTGNVSSTIGSAGGVVGNNSGTVENSYNTGTVSSTIGSAGGVVGLNNAGGTVENSVSLGLTVAGTTDVGRVAGLNAVGGILTNNRARADMTPTGVSNANGEDGESVAVGTGTPQASVFTDWGWSAAIWTIGGNLGPNALLPRLVGVGGNQDPRLP